MTATEKQRVGRKPQPPATPKKPPTPAPASSSQPKRFSPATASKPPSSKRSPPTPATPAALSTPLRQQRRPLHRAPPPKKSTGAWPSPAGAPAERAKLSFPGNSFISTVRQNYIHSLKNRTWNILFLERKLFVLRHPELKAQGHRDADQAYVTVASALEAVFTGVEMNHPCPPSPPEQPSAASPTPSASISPRQSRRRRRSRQSPRPPLRRTSSPNTTHSRNKFLQDSPTESPPHPSARAAVSSSGGISSLSSVARRNRIAPKISALR